MFVEPVIDGSITVNTWVVEVLPRPMPSETDSSGLPAEVTDGEALDGTPPRLSPSDKDAAAFSEEDAVPESAESERPLLMDAGAPDTAYEDPVKPSDSVGTANGEVRGTAEEGNAVETEGTAIPLIEVEPGARVCTVIPVDSTMVDRGSMFSDTLDERRADVISL